MDQEIHDTIDEQYRQTPVGVHKLFDLIRTNHPNITRRMVQDYLKGNVTQQRHTIPKQRKTVRTVIPTRVLAHLQADLIDYSKKQQYHQHYVLLVVDMFSKYVWARASPRKEAALIATRMENILQEIMALPIYAQNPIRAIQTDGGKEFKGAFATLLRNMNIRHMVSLAQTPTSQGVVERNVGTFKRYEAKYRDMNGGDWRTNMPHIINIMNTTRSEAHKQIPAEVLADPAIMHQPVRQRFIDKANRNDQRLAQLNEQPLHVGDRVRRRTPPKKLGFRGENFSPEIFEIIQVKTSTRPFVAIRYKIRDTQTNIDINKLYYREDLLLV